MNIDAGLKAILSYLQDAENCPAEVALDVEALPEPLRALGAALDAFIGRMLEAHAFATELSRGNLNAQPPGRENVLAGPLKALHASLRHMTWQSQQVAKGDYNQKLDFLGNFAEAFNSMTGQLSERQQALESEIEKGRSRQVALAQANSLLAALTEGMPNWIVVLDNATGERLFANRAAREGFAREGHFGADLWNWLISQASEVDFYGVRDYAAEDGSATCYLSIASYPLYWGDHRAVAYVLEDVSASRMYMRELERHAYSDTLTRLNSRFYGMQVLEAWLDERRAFVLCFVDLDSLKYVNDNFGHSEGDRYIISAASAIRGLSEDAMYCRLGGDEFMILIPEGDVIEIEKRLRKIRARLSASSAKDAAPYPRGLSFGLVDVKSDNLLPASALLSMADERMYNFKRSHRRARRVRNVRTTL